MSRSGLPLALLSVAALAVAGLALPRGSAARAPGRIRRATIDEVEPIFRASGINLAPYEEPYEVFEVDGEAVAASSFGWYDRSGDGKIASFSVAVLPSARRMGIGERLVKSLVRQHPGARFEPWVISPKMAQLLEGLGFSSEGREWTPDSPHMTYETPSRAQARARKARVAAPPPPPPPPERIPEWTEMYRAPVRLDQLGLDGSALAEAIRLRAHYTADPNARDEKVAELRGKASPVPGLTLLSAPGRGDYWQLVLKVDPKGRDEGRVERMDRLRRRPEGSPARASFAQSLSELDRASLVLPRIEGEWPHPIYGKQALTLLAHAYPVDAFRRLVAYAVEASKRGLVSLPVELPPAPPKRLWPELDARWAAERAKPLVFEPVQRSGMAPGINAYLGTGRYDRVEIGHIVLAQSYGLIPSCADDLAVLQRAHGRAPVVEVSASTIRYALLRGRGLGRKLYDALIAHLLPQHPEGVYLVPNRCGSGDTSPDADRVWAALRRSYPHHGLVVFVPSEPQ